MLILMFQVGGMAYAVAATAVVEVVPRVGLRPIPHAPAHLVGLLKYRGGAVPVVDLGVLMGGPPSRDRLDTRIILARHDADAAGGLLGLVAERVDRVRQVDPADRAGEGLGLAAAPYLGESYRVGDGLCQMIEPARIAVGGAAGAGAGGGVAP